jgi:hypothetical protein
MAKINAKTTGGGGVETAGDASGVLELQSAGTTMATISPSGFNLGSGTPSAQTALSPYTGFKNRIINGAMMIDERNNGASVTPTNTYTLDRWQFAVSQTSKLTVQQNAGSVTPPAGFKNYLGITSSSSYSVVSSDYFVAQQPIEGFNTADLNWGTANAATVTLSFWVRSSLTGTFGGALGNGVNNRSYVFSYTILAANTWEYKTVTIAGDTTGTWATDNNAGVVLRFNLGSGSTYLSTAGSWAASPYYGLTGSNSLVGTSGATLYITGVQIEVGTSATSFEYRSIGTELDLCQRYFVGLYEYWFTSGYDPSYTLTNNGGLAWSYQMRTTPSIVIASGGMSGHHGIAPTAGSIARNGVALSFSGAALRTNAVTSANVAFTLNAEL